MRSSEQKKRGAAMSVEKDELEGDAGEVLSSTLLQETSVETPLVDALRSYFSSERLVEKAA